MKTLILSVVLIFSFSNISFAETHKAQEYKQVNCPGPECPDHLY